MKLCGYCLATVFPRNYSMCGYAKAGTGEPLQLNVSNVVDLVESGATIYDARGYVMEMKAIATIRGSHVCAQHAIEEVLVKT